ncbi:hypothetical protein JKP88DRAFT_246098 [Tribonema minus]|uniref:Protein kinase domain-containing protein n=1 Tax=Tribonema minus TaxID=303371 RepID=A0A835YUU0_9STRA|nr:hypothetical protein JKP88DRAFT_246098 [Tribonema minus]
MLNVDRGWCEQASCEQYVAELLLAVGAGQARVEPQHKPPTAAGAGQLLQLDFRAVAVDADMRLRGGVVRVFGLCVDDSTDGGPPNNDAVVHMHVSPAYSNTFDAVKHHLPTTTVDEDFNVAFYNLRPLAVSLGTAPPVRLKFAGFGLIAEAYERRDVSLPVGWYEVVYGGKAHGKGAQRRMTDPVLRALGAPVVLISIEGPLLGVFGAYVKDSNKVVCEPLIPPLLLVNLTGRDGYGKHLESVARVLSATYVAITWLRPCTRQLDKKLQSAKETAVAIHKVWAQAELAPQLVEVLQLPGDQTMVVMEYLRREDGWRMLWDLKGEEQQCAFEAAQEALRRAHAIQIPDACSIPRGAVHGDMRGPNIMVRQDDDRAWQVKFINFDWSGLEGSGVYPGCLFGARDYGFHVDARARQPMWQVHDTHLLQTCDPNKQ